MNNSIKKGIIVAVILLFVSVSVIPSTGTTFDKNSTIPTFYDGNLLGYVNDTFNNPIAGVRVRVYFHGTYEENYTDSSGYYHITNIPICWCLKNCTASKNEYKTEWVLLSIGENTTYDFVLTPLDPHCYPVFNGTMGENGWYVSCVEINFTIDDNVSTIYYSIGGGSWQTFDGVPIIVCDDGLYIFCWYYIDDEGNVSAIECIEFKIDQTPPAIDLTLEPDKKDGIWYITFTATCSDATSCMNYVEFYTDDELMCTDNEAPYEWIYTVPFVSHVIGLIFNPQFSQENIAFFALSVIITNEHNSNSVYSKDFYAIAYDLAGNSEKDTITGISYNPPGVYMFQRLTFQNNYKGYIGKFLIRATFDYE